MDWFKTGVALSIIGGVVKLLGSIAYDSKALLVDGVTCIAGIIAGIVALRWMRASEAPPDVDHPYGHERLAFGGVAFMLVAYGTAAGFGLAYLLNVEEYSVGVEAGLLGLAGLVIYSGAVYMFRRSGVVGEAMAAFTASEIVESAVSAVAALGGSMIGYLIDYVGAWLIESYLIYELVQHSRQLIHHLSDIVTREAVETVREELESRGFRVLNVRLRQVVPGEYQGDAIVLPPRGIDPVAADILADEAVYSLAEKGIDLTVHIDLARGLIGKAGKR